MEASPNTPDESWVQALADFIYQNQGVEAIRIHPERKEVALATLGEVDAALLQKRLSEVLRELDENWLVEKRHLPKPDAAPPSLDIDRTAHGVTLQLRSCPTAPRFWRWRRFEWPEAEEMERRSGEEWRALAMQAGICGVALVTGFVLERQPAVPAYMPYLAYSISLLAGAWDAAQDAWESLRRREIEVHFLMLAVAAGAVAIGAWEEGALLLFLFSTSGALEHYALHRTHREINSLTRAAPKYARVVQPDGSLAEREVTLLRAGDVIEIRPEELFPADGIVTKGESAADESTLTGESVPVEKNPGTEVFSGALNLWGLLRVEVTRPAAQSALAKIIDLIQNAQKMRAPSQRFTDRFGTGYTLVVLGTVAIMFLVWWLALDVPAFENRGDSKSAFYRAMTLLVVMSPCALVLSIPSAILAAIAWGARRGILFRGGAAIEKLAEVEVVAMDKTGTLTEGDLRVTQMESFPSGKETVVLELAATLDANSNHPIARAITKRAAEAGLRPGVVREFHSLPGAGVRGETQVGTTYVGRRELLEISGFGGWIKDLPEPPLGVTEVWVISSALVGRILLQDRIRAGSRQVLETLKREGVRTIMLTGDRRAAAAHVAEELGVAEVRSGLHPEDKVAAIQELTASGLKVAMIGDGVNDAPCLAAAYVSVAMGARGSDAALEQADVVLMQDRIEKFLSARHISQFARRIIHQNLVIALGSVTIMAVAALFGIVPLTLGVLTHEGSTVLVCLNSLRLLLVPEAHAAAAPKSPPSPPT